MSRYEIDACRQHPFDGPGHVALDARHVRQDCAVLEMGGVAADKLQHGVGGHAEDEHVGLGQEFPAG